MQEKNSLSSINQYASIFDGLPGDFNKKAVELFKRQYLENIFYRQFSDRFLSSPEEVTDLTRIPFLPVSFFKTQPIVCGAFEPQQIFTSSGTSDEITSRHFVKEINLYRESFTRGFEIFYGEPAKYCVIGLLPAYLERTGSSLVFMADELIRRSLHADSGFYLYDFERLRNTLLKLEASGQPTILIGVSFALLDFAEKYPMQLTQTIVMETGGMKGRRKEITRSELHETIKRALGVSVVHSEYGMTELLSQAYSAGEGIYRPVPWMKVLARQEDDPLQIQTVGEGLLNVIDFANRDSCSFIATDDVVKISGNGDFEVLGRMDNSDIRGCSLLVV